MADYTPASVTNVSFVLNGSQISHKLEHPSLLLLDYLHSTGLFGTKYGCGEGGCGACTIMIRKKGLLINQSKFVAPCFIFMPSGEHQYLTANSCLRPLAACEGYEILTIEGLPKDNSRPLPMPTGSVNADGQGKTTAAPNTVNSLAYKIAAVNASQCGYCTPGFTMTLAAAKERCKDATCPEQDVLRDIEELHAGHICRCTGYRGLRYAAKQVLLEYELSSEAKQTPQCVVDCNQQSYITGQGGMQNDLVTVVSVDADRPQNSYKPKPPPTTSGFSTAASRQIGPPNPVTISPPAVMSSRDGEHVPHAGQRWYYPKNLTEVQTTLNHHSKNAKLVFGNTSAGIFKKKEWDDVESFINMNGISEASHVLPDVHHHQDSKPFLRIPMACTINNLKRFVQQDTEKYSEFAALLTLLQRVAGNQVRDMGTVCGSVAMAIKHGFLSDTFLGLTICGATANVLVKTEDRGTAIWESHENMPLFQSRATIALTDLRDRTFIICNFEVPLHSHSRANMDQFPGTFIWTRKVARRLQMAHSLCNFAGRLDFADSNFELVAMVTFIVGNVNSWYATLPMTSELLKRILVEKHRHPPSSEKEIHRIIEELLLAAKKELETIVHETEENDPSSSRIALASNLLLKFLLHLFSWRYPSLIMQKDANYNSYAEKLVASNDAVGMQAFCVNDRDFPVTEPMVKTTAVEQALGQLEYTRTIDYAQIPNCVHATFVLSSVTTGRLHWREDHLGNNLSCNLSDHIRNKFGVFIDAKDIYFYRAADIGYQANQLTAANSYQPFKEFLLADIEVVFYGQPVAILVTPFQWSTEYLARLLATGNYQEGGPVDDRNQEFVILRFEKTYEPILTLDEPVNKMIPVYRRDYDHNRVYQDMVERKFSTFDSVGGQWQAVNWISNMHSQNTSHLSRPPRIDWDYYHAHPKKYAVVEGSHEVGSQVHFYMETQSALALPPSVPSTGAASSNSNDHDFESCPVSKLKSVAHAVHFSRAVQNQRKVHSNTASTVDAAPTLTLAPAPAPAPLPVLKSMQVHASTQSSLSVASTCSSFLQKVHAANFYSDPNDFTTQNARYEVQTLIPAVGGGFGGKEPQSRYVAVAASFVADRLGLPCRLVLDRNTDMTMIGKAHPYRGNYRMAVNLETSKIEAMFIHYLSDAGYSYDASLPIMDLSVLSSCNAYNISSFVCQGDVYFSNKATNTALRSFGVVQANQITEFAIEHMCRKLASVRANSLGLERYYFRKYNFFSWKPTYTTPDQQTPTPDNDFDKTPFGQPIRGCNMDGVWLSLSRRVYEYARKLNNIEARDETSQPTADKPFGGIELLSKSIDNFNSRHNFVKQGFSIIPLQYPISFTSIPMNSMKAVMSIDADTNIVTIQCLGVEMGQGLQTKLLQIASSALGIRPHYVRIVSLNPKDNEGKTLPGTGASTGTDLNGRAVSKLAEDLVNFLKDQVNDPVARNFLAYRDDHHQKWYDHVSVQASSEQTGDIWPQIVSYLVTQQKLSWVATVNFMDLLLAIDQSTKNGSPFYYFNYAACMVHVQLDCLTGEWRNLGTVLLYDAGISINPAIDIGQIEGGFGQGTGYVTTEEVIIHPKTGKLLSNGTWTYKPPQTTEIPEKLHVFLYPCDDQDILLLNETQQRYLHDEIKKKSQEETARSADADGSTAEMRTNWKVLVHKVMTLRDAFVDPLSVKSALKSVAKREYSISQMIDSFGIKSAKTSGEPPLVLANALFFALQDAVDRFHEERSVSAAIRLKCPATTYALVDALASASNSMPPASETGKRRQVANVSRYDESGASLKKERSMYGSSDSWLDAGSKRKFSDE
jgi:xanthine dehydrogenase molybdopterin-binding subunit B/xanthine dehydrogenase iron-sulfur cluster and FAD-binding subunit A